jgi:hypothetical protein
MSYKCKMCLKVFSSRKDIKWRRDKNGNVCKECLKILPPETSEIIIDRPLTPEFLERLVALIEKIKNHPDEKIGDVKEALTLIDMTKVDYKPETILTGELERIETKSYKDVKTGKTYKCRSY